MPMRLSPALLLWSLAVMRLAQASALPTPHLVVQAPALPDGWRRQTAQLPADATVSFAIVLKGQHEQKLLATARAVSDPASPRHGRFLTREQVDALTKPRATDTAIVRGWLDAANITTHELRGVGDILVTASASAAGALLRTTFHRVATTSGGDLKQQAVIEAAGYELPSDVHAAVATIFGLHGLPLPPEVGAGNRRRAGGNLQRRLQPPPPPPPVTNVTPSVIRDAYGVPAAARGQKHNHTQRRQAVVEFQGQFMNSTDLAAFFKEFVPDYTAGLDDVVSKFVGPHFENSKGIEAELDVQYLMGVAPGVGTEFWEFPNQDFGSDLNAWTSQLVATGDDEAPLVWSVSYGWQGNLSLVHTKAADVAAVELNLAKLAARGFSIIFSSGDSGSGYVEGDSGCKTPDVGKAVSGTVLKSFPNVPHMYMCCNEAHGEYAPGWSCVTDGGENSPPSPPPPAGGGCGTCTLYSSVTGRPEASNTTQSSVQTGRVQLWASWPASSPWVTAVGGTRFVDPNDTKSGQVAVDEFGSGGGFSTMYKQAPHAAWQEAAVARYLRTVDKATLPPAGSIGFDPAARGTPDVSVLAEGFNLIAGGATHVVGGTSAAAPAFAALVSLMNEARSVAGKPPMGFLNPFLYSQEAEGGFTDVTVGSNKRDRAGTPWPFGYNCSKGWDPVTGLGTPLFDKLLAAAMKLDDVEASAASASTFASATAGPMYVKAGCCEAFIGNLRAQTLCLANAHTCGTKRANGL